MKKCPIRVPDVLPSFVNLVCMSLSRKQHKVYIKLVQSESMPLCPVSEKGFAHCERCYLVKRQQYATHTHTHTPARVCVCVHACAQHMQRSQLFLSCGFQSRTQIARPRIVNRCYLAGFCNILLIVKLLFFSDSSNYLGLEMQLRMYSVCLACERLLFLSPNITKNTMEYTCKLQCSGGSAVSFSATQPVGGYQGVKPCLNGKRKRKFSLF